ncbi:ABC transporter substrate-binding protein [Plantactinospora sp. CA-290183]|uniref:ABC transporter substrate-binding protein n=1 Tax=Plantactinospora sp. CA-290183 TaxID=3240006 RepID=UPI003D8BB4F6
MTASINLSRRSVLGLAGAGAMLLGTSACGSDEDGSGGVDAPGEIDVWVLQDEPQNQVQTAAVGRFNGRHKAQAKITPFASDAYRDRLRVAMGSRTQPDIFFNWGSGSIREYVDADLLVDLTPALNEDTAFKARWIPSVLESGKIGDKFYGIPNRGMQPVLLYYNRDVLKRVNVEQPPATWSEMLGLVDELRGAGITPFAVAGSQSWTLLMWLEYFLDRIGGPEVFKRIADGDSEGWKDPAVAASIDRIRELVDRGGFASNFASVGYETGGAGTLFAQGRAAMHLMGSWEYTNQVREQPQFAKNGLGFMNFPAVDGGRGNPRAVVGNPTNYFSVTESSDNVEASIAFLKEMATDAYVDQYIARGDVPAVADIESRFDKSPSPEFARFVYGMVTQASSFQLSWDQAIANNIAQPMLTNLQKVFLRQLDATGFVNAMVKIR